MSIVNLSLPDDGTTADVADYNTPITSLLSDYNGNIDNNNIASGAAISGSKLANTSVPAGKIDFGGAGVGVWWEEIGRTTLGSPLTNVSVSGLPTRRFLRIIGFIFNSGGTHNVVLRFNADTGSNYAYRFSEDGSADTASVSQTGIVPVPGVVSQTSYLFAEVVNAVTSEKLVIASGMRQGTAGAGSSPTRRETTGKWVNTSVAISQVNLVLTSGTGSFGTGSQLIILGHD